MNGDDDGRLEPAPRAPPSCKRRRTGSSGSGPRVHAVWQDVETVVGSIQHELAARLKAVERREAAAAKREAACARAEAQHVACCALLRAQAVAAEAAAAGQLPPPHVAATAAAAMHTLQAFGGDGDGGGCFAADCERSGGLPEGAGSLTGSPHNGSPHDHTSWHSCSGGSMEELQRQLAAAAAQRRQEPAFSQHSHHSTVSHATGIGTANGESPDSPRSQMHYGPTTAAALHRGGAAAGNFSRSGSPDHPAASFGFSGGDAGMRQPANPPTVPRSPFMDHHGEAVDGGGIGHALLSQLSFPKLAAAATGGSGPVDVSTPMPFGRSLGHSGISAASYGGPAQQAAEEAFPIGGSTLPGAPTSAIHDIGRIDSTAGSTAHGLHGNGSVHGGSAISAPLGSNRRSPPDSPDGATGGSGGHVRIKISNTGSRLAAPGRRVGSGGNSSFGGSLRVSTGDDLRAGSWPVNAASTEGVKSEHVLRLPSIKQQALPPGEACRSGISGGAEAAASVDMPPASTPCAAAGLVSLASQPVSAAASSHGGRGSSLRAVSSASSLQAAAGGGGRKPGSARRKPQAQPAVPRSTGGKSAAAAAWEGGGEPPLVFSKTLDYKSCDHILCLTKDMARHLLPPAPQSCSTTGSSCQMQVVVEDENGREWPMTYRSVPARYSYEFRAGWKALAAAWGITTGDAITLRRLTADRHRLHIEIQRGPHTPTTSAAVTKAGRGRGGSRSNSPAEAAVPSSQALGTASADSDGPAMAPLLAAVQQAAVAEHMES